jgi:hypothetical protein
VSAAAGGPTTAEGYDADHGWLGYTRRTGHDAACMT